MFWASYWLIINTNGTSLPITVHLHVCNQWDVSNTDQVATVRRNLLPLSSALICHPMRWEKQGLGGNCQINLLPASRALHSQSISNKDRGATAISPCCRYNVLCYAIIRSNVRKKDYWPLKIIKRWTNHHVLMLDSHCFLWWLYITQPVCVMKFSLNVFEAKTLRFYWDYLVMWKVIHCRWRIYY
jgi:hypothetical protein